MGFRELMPSTIGRERAVRGPSYKEFFLTRVEKLSLDSWSLKNLARNPCCSVKWTILCNWCGVWITDFVEHNIYQR